MNISLLYARSRALFICSFIFYYLICFVISCFPLDKYTKLPDGQFMLLLLGSQCVCVFIAYYVAQLTAYGRPEVEIMHDGINITWKKNFLLGRKPDRKILYSDIRSHERISGIRGGGYVLMGLADGSKMKLYEGLLLIGKVQGFQHFIDDVAAGRFRRNRHQGIEDRLVARLPPSETFGQRRKNVGGLSEQFACLRERLGRQEFEEQRHVIG